MSLFRDRYTVGMEPLYIRPSIGTKPDSLLAHGDGPVWTLRITLATQPITTFTTFTINKIEKKCIRNVEWAMTKNILSMTFDAVVRHLR